MSEELNQGTIRPLYGERKIAESEIICFENPNKSRNYQIIIDLPEFTCKCPFSGYPDFAKLKVTYQPKETETIYLNQEYLMGISSNSKGHYAHHSHLKTILEKIDTEPKEINEKIRVNSFTYKYFWLFFILLISTEWYLRNKIGLL